MRDTIHVVFKQSSSDDRQLLGIVASSSNDVSGKKSVTFSPEDRYYDSNEWYALDKIDKTSSLKRAAEEM